MSTEKYITKIELESKVKDYVNALDVIDTTKKTIQGTLRSFTNQYDEQEPLEVNITIFLQNFVTISSFETAKNRLRKFINSVHLDVDIDSLGIEFIPVYVTIEDIQSKFAKIENDKLWLTDNILSEQYQMLKMYVYLLWIGVPKKHIFDLKRRDYDVADKILTDNDKKFFLRSIYYSDVCDLLHGELQKNIRNYSFVVMDKLSVYCIVPDYEFTDSDLDKTIIDLQNCKFDSPSYFLDRLTKKYVYSSKIITKSGAMQRISTWEKVNNRSAIPSIMSVVMNEANIFGSERVMYIDYLQYKKTL